MTIDAKLVDELLKDYKNPENLIGETGLLKQLTTALLERALSAEMNVHLGYAKHEPAQGHQKPGLVPERRCGSEVVLPGATQHRQEMENADP